MNTVINKHNKFSYTQFMGTCSDFVGSVNKSHASGKKYCYI